MKDVFNKRQRFSLRKYSVGVCSVLLGTALFAAGAQSASADEATVASESAGTAASEAAQPATTESSQAEAPAASKAYGEGGSVPKIDLSGTAAATSETPASAIEKAEATATPAATEKQVAPAETKKTEEASKPLNVGSLPEIALPVTNKAELSSKPASTTAPTTATSTTAPTTSTRAAAGESSERAAAREEAATPAGTTTFSATVNPAASITGTEPAAQTDKATSTDAAAAVANAATERTNAGALAVSNRRRNRRATADHNSEPVAVATFLKDGEVATPEMTDPNGASVRSQTVPSGYAAKEGDVYTYSIVDLTRFNERYNTNYYTRAYKRFDASTDTTVELIDKNTGNVVETRKITASSGIQKFTTTATASRGELTWQVDYDPGTGAGPGKTDQPFIQLGYEVGASIQALVAPGHNLTPDEKKLYDDVYAARTSTDIINVVEPAYNGRTITDTNAKIPVSVNKTTYYKVVDKNNPTFNANKTDVTVQDYKANGNEVDLASYTLKAMEGQNFTASGERQFDGYKLYQTADANDQSGYVSRPYTVGTRFMDAERAGIKRIKEIVGEDGTVVVRVYLLDPKQQNKRSDGTLSTDGYMLLAETKPIKPGDYNKQELNVKKSPLNTIPFTDSKGVTYANGKEVPFDFQKAAGYTPYKTVFVPFLGDNIGHLSPNEQLIRGVTGIGTNVDLLNSLTPYKQPVYYYVKQEPVTVTPEVEKQLEGRVLVDGEFSFKIKEVNENKSLPSYEETVTNKNGKATFSNLTFNKVGTYLYTITERAGSDTNVDYDAMTVTMKVTVTENSKGDLQASVKYSGTGGFAASADDKIFNNYVVAPVKTKFDFTKALAGRELKAGEFSFVLKDSNGKALQTKTNTKQGVVAFDDLTFDNTQVGTHKYTVEEVIPENKETGMTYDTMKAEVTITVTKEGHVLKATNTLPSDTEFNNTFTPVATQAQFKFTKKLEGKELTKDAFTFELLEKGNVIQTKKNAADGTIQFDAISYDKEGPHTYTVREVAGTDTNIDYDNMNAVVTVNVTKDAASGVLTAKVTMPEDTEFNNFAVAPVKTRFDFSKALAGRELKEGEFTFVLKDANGKTLQTKTNTKQGVVAFDDLTFDNTQVGTHKYTVEEVIPENKETGMTYDTMKAEVTITVTKEGHVLKATKSLPADTEFNNTFTPAATQAQFKFTKRLEGKELTKDAFTFELLENGNVIQTKKNAADGSITFDAIEYNAVGEHTYTVREVAGADTNIDYDSMNAVVTVNVTKNAATGILSAAVTMPEDTEFNNYVVSPVVTKFDFTKKLAGRKLAAGEFSFVLKDSTGREVETVQNDADGNVTFSELSFDNTKVGTHTYTVEEVIPADKEFGMTYDQMKATVTVEVAKNGHSLTTVTNVTSTGGKDANGNATDGTADKEFNNKVTPPETPEFQPEKFVVSKEKYDITGHKLTDDDDDVPGNEYTATNANPYVDGVTNNEPENLNTKTVERGSKLVYQVWLDTTKFTEANNIQYVGVSDTYDAEKLDVNAADIKAYDSVTGAEVTNKFDIKVENGTITATSKEAFIKDKVNAPVIDTTKFEFGRYYKFDIPATVKESVKAGADIENTANQTVHVYNPVSKTVEKPEKPTQKRVNSVPVPVEMNFTKRLEGRELQANEFEFVLKKDGVEVERVKNDAAGKIVFKTLEFGRDDLGKTYNYTVEETPGTDATVKYDTMVATVKVVVSHDGTAKAIVANVTDAADKEFNNRVTPPEEPKFQPEKYVVSKEKYDITGDKLVDDDKELADKYADTNANPYADDASNNEAENLNTKTVERGSKLVYQVWLDTTKFDAANKDNIQTVGISDNYDEAKLNLNKADIKAYDSVTGAEVTDKFDITVNNGVITATLKDGFTKSLGDAENTQVIDTTKFAFGRYYKFDIPTTVKDDVVAGADIENTAAQVVNYYNPTTKKVEKPEKPTEKRVNNVPISVEFNFTKKLEGRALKAGEFTFELKDSDNVVIATATNDADGNFKFTPVDYTNKAGKTVTALKYQKGQEGTYTYTVTEVKGTDATVAYDPMAAVVTVTVSHDGTAKALITNVTEPADKEFNNRVTPPTEPKFQPEKYVVSKAKFDITGTKLVDDDSELTDKYGETNTNPYVDTTANNEDENLNTKTVERGQKLYYQVWLDTTKFDANNKDNIQTVGITDNYDKDKLTVNASDIKVYDSVTGADVTTKFDISDNNGVLTANLKAGFTKSLGDAENTQIIDTTKFEFGRYYKFDIPATVKDDVVAGADIENKAAQVVNYYNPVSKTVEKPNKPTEKRVNSVPISVEFNFTKKLEGRDLKAGEFTFELKDSDNVVIATTTNDKAGKIKFAPVEYTNKAGKTVTALKYQKGQEGTYKYTVEEVKGSDATVTYDTMKAVVTVEVRHDGTAKALITNVTDPADKEFNNTVRPPEEPKFQPEKYVVSEEKFDITGDKLVDDDKELADKVADTNANPYADDASNNEKQNINTKTVKRGDKLVYQVWLDTTKFDAANKDNIQSVGISDDYDETKLDLDSTKIKAYDSVTGDDVTAKFDIAVNNGVITATLKDGFTKSLGDAENTQIIDTTKFAFGRYYKFDIPTTVKADVPGGVDIENTAAQVVNYYNPTTKKVEKPSKPTEKRVNNVPVEVEFNFTKRLEGRELKANEFSFVLKDSEGKTLETVSNDASGNVKFSKLEFKKGQEGVHNYTVEEVKGSDATVTYDTMKANVTVTVKHDGTAKVLIATVGEIADKEFNNRVTPPEEPKFQPEKYVVSEEKFDITGDKLVDDDKELADKVADTNANPYADDASNNEKQNINTKTVKRGDKLVYQVWLDTTKFDAANKDNIQSVGISDDYDETKLDLDSTKIKAYDSVTGDDVTAKFDIAVNNGVITATLKDGFTKSLGDAENTQIIDTTKFAFGRYYKFDIPTTVKADVPGGVDIENTAAQVVNYYNPTTKKVEKPSKPTEKRVNSVPVEVEFNFTKRMEGRDLKANEFSFVLKDSEGTTLETVKNDASGNVKFSKLEFKKGQEGVHNYTVEEVKGSDATVTYDTMKANVTVTVKHDGTAKVLIATVGDIADKEFNNKVTPPETPEFNPEKYILNAEKFDLTGKSLLDDDKELADKVAETNANPYADKADNNEAANINTKTVKRGDKVVYQVWLDTTKFTEAHNIQSVGVTDDYEEDKLDINVANIKAYDSVTGEDVTAKFDIKVENGVISATSKADLTKSLGDAENTPVIDTTKFAFGRYYKFDIPATVKDTVKGGADIENTAAQIVHQYDPTSKTVKKPNKPTEKRVVNIPVSVEFNFTKRLEGRELKANEFSFVLKDSEGKTLETVKNDASGNVKFSALEFKKGQEGTYNYTVEEVKGTDTTVTYDTMKAVVTVEVSHDGTAKALLTKVTDPSDKEFNNTVRPPETPEFNPEKYILNESKFDLTGVKLLDDDKELKDKVADTNANPYVDKTDNNEAQNINTKTLKKGDKVYYQVWLDTTKFTEAHNIQSVGVTDKYDSANLNVNGADIKAYDSVTGEDVTAKFDIKVENGVITATSKADLTKSLGDAENTQVIDTTKLAFGRYYKFEIPAEIKQSAQEGVDIENTASQIVHQYDPTKKTVEKPEKPTEKRVVNIPVKVQFQFTKKLEGRELKAGEFSFVLKDEKGNVIETVTNDAAGKITFSNLEFKRGEEGTHLYHVEEIRGTDSSVEYDKMVATVGIMINKDGKVLTAVTQLPEDTEFNNTVIPPTPPTTPPNTPPTTPPNTPPTPPTTPPNTPPTPPTTPPNTPPTPPTPTTPPAPALPETGEDQSASAALLGAALGMVGLAGLAKRKKSED